MPLQLHEKIQETYYVVRNKEYLLCMWENNSEQHPTYTTNIL